MAPNSAPLDLKYQYSEGGSALRHYSLCILNVRAVTLAQGLILLAGASFLIRECMLFLSLVVSAFGLSSRSSFGRFSVAIGLCFDCMLQAVIRLEEYSRPSEGPPGPLMSYRGQKKGRIWPALVEAHHQTWSVLASYSCFLCSHIWSGRWSIWAAARLRVALCGPRGFVRGSIEIR